MTDEPTKESPADRFKLMAGDIEHNAHRGFGGACVIYPPEGGGGPIEFLVIGQGDIAQFYSNIQTRTQMALETLNAPKQPFRTVR